MLIFRLHEKLRQQRNKKMREEAQNIEKNNIKSTDTYENNILPVDFKNIGEL